MQTNYIKHLTATFHKMADDERLTPFHISLYFTLFQFWNLNRFKNPISIARQETMKLSKIGSVNTYIKCIKELDKWDYLKYLPSHNPLKGSLINLYNFNNTTNNATDISPNKSKDTTTKKTRKQAVIPSINTLNYTNKLNSVNKNEQSQENNSNNFSDENSKNNSKSEQNKKEKLRQKKKASTNSELPTRAQSRYERPLLQIVKNYFETKNWTTTEADKFYNHYESNGWLVGGKTPMANWMASAENWIINSVKFANDKKTGNTIKSGRLTTSSDKNYSEPL